MAALITLSVIAGVAGRTVTFNNLKPRLDINGNIIDAHDGSIQVSRSPLEYLMLCRGSRQMVNANAGPSLKFKGPYYMHAVQYGLCKEPANLGCDQTADRCGFKYDHNISIW